MDRGWQPLTTLASPGSLPDSPVPPPPGVAEPLTGTARTSIIQQSQAPAPDIPIKHFTLTLVASSWLGITSSIFPRRTEPTGQAGDQKHPHPGAGLITTGTHFNQEELRHSWGKKPSAFPGTDIHLCWRRKQPWSRPGEPRVYASAFPISGAVTGQNSGIPGKWQAGGKGDPE